MGSNHWNPSVNKVFWECHSWISSLELQSVKEVTDYSDVNVLRKHIQITKGDEHKEWISLKISDILAFKIDVV